MDRLITVRGVGKASVKPDLVRVAMRLESKDKDYGKAMGKAADRIRSLLAAMAAIGFQEDDVKTSDFSVRTTSEYKHSFGHAKEVQTGFQVSQRVKLEFDLDLDRLSDVLGAISQWSKSDPDLSVIFTVKDPAAVRDAVLQSVAVNARRQAEALCGASGVKLGDLVKIDYSWKEVEFRSPTSYGVSYTVTRDISSQSLSRSMPDRSAVAAIRPDDIKVEDSAAFVWEIA